MISRSRLLRFRIFFSLRDIQLIWIRTPIVSKLNELNVLKISLKLTSYHLTSVYLVSLQKSRVKHSIIWYAAVYSQAVWVRASVTRGALGGTQTLSTDARAALFWHPDWHSLNIIPSKYFIDIDSPMVKSKLMELRVILKHGKVARWWSARKRDPTLHVKHIAS